MIEKFPIARAARIGAVVLVVVTVAILSLIIIARGRRIQELEERMDAAIELADKEIARIEAEAEEEKDRVEKILEDMPADAVAIKFLDDDDIFERAAVIDEIARNIIEHQLEFFRTMGVELVEVRRTGVQ